MAMAFFPKRTPEQCRGLAASYAQDGLFRQSVIMARQGFGRGKYRYFDDPLPKLILTLRQDLYPPLAEIAKQWQTALGSPIRFPLSHAEYLEGCHAAGQTKRTPLLLQYREGDYNCLHQDLYAARIPAGPTPSSGPYFLMKGRVWGKALFCRRLIHWLAATSP